MPRHDRLTDEDISTITVYNMHEKLLELSDDELLDPRIPERLFSGLPGSQQNNIAMQFLQYRQIVESIRALRSNLNLTRTIACFTVVTGISTIVIALGTLVMAFK